MNQAVWKKRAITKDQKAMEELYDAYSAALYGHILRRVKKPAIAEDLLQDVFVKVWKNVDKFDPEKGRLFTWLHRITMNTVNSHFTARAQKLQLEQLDYTGETYSNYSSYSSHEYLDIKGSISNLQPQLKEVIELVYFTGYSQSEAAKILKIPLGTVKTRCRIALRQLRKLHYVSPAVASGTLLLLILIIL